MPLKKWDDGITKKLKDMSSFMTTFTFPPKIESSSAKKIVEPILETWNANYVFVYVWIIHSPMKNFQEHAI